MIITRLLMPKDVHFNIRNEHLFIYVLIAEVLSIIKLLNP